VNIKRRLKRRLPGQKTKRQEWFYDANHFFVEEMAKQLRRFRLKDLEDETMFSRPTVKKHLKSFIEKGVVQQDGKEFVWVPYRKLEEQYHGLQQKLDTAQQQLNSAFNEITQKNLQYNEKRKELDAAFNVITQKNILMKLGVTKPSSVAEFADVRREVQYELERPKLPDLYEFHKKKSKSRKVVSRHA
jgi:predicted transcriptional regulator